MSTRHIQQAKVYLGKLSDVPVSCINPAIICFREAIVEYDQRVAALEKQVATLQAQLGYEMTGVGALRRAQARMSGTEDIQS